VRRVEVEKGRRGGVGERGSKRASASARRRCMPAKMPCPQVPAQRAAAAAPACVWVPVACVALLAVAVCAVACARCAALAHCSHSFAPAACLPVLCAYCSALSPPVALAATARPLDDLRRPTPPASASASQRRALQLCSAAAHFTSSHNHTINHQYQYVRRQSACIPQTSALTAPTPQPPCLHLHFIASLSSDSTLKGMTLPME
jgi:hypothetical protein